MGNVEVKNSLTIRKGFIFGFIFTLGYFLIKPINKKLIDILDNCLTQRRKENLPKRIILIRHGQSIGNVTEKIYEHTPDNKVGLSEVGIEQALKAGQELKKIIGEEKVKFYVSPFLRARQTFDNIAKSFDNNQYILEEDPRLREQEWGNFQNYEEFRKVKEDRKKVGRFYYRFNTGESGADVFDRVSLFLSSFYRRVEADKIKEHLNYQNVVLITHGLFIQLFLTRFFYWTVDDFEKLENPKNCEIIAIEKNKHNCYTLKTEIRKIKTKNENL